MAEQGIQIPEEEGLSAEVSQEISTLTGTDRAALLALLMAETQAAEVVSLLRPKEVSALGRAMVNMQDTSPEAVDHVLDTFLRELRAQTSLGFGGTEYVEAVFEKALGEEKAATVLAKVIPGGASKRLDILSWMSPRAINDMIESEHPQIIAIILSVLEEGTAADVLTFLPEGVRAEVVQRIAVLDTVQPTAMRELESVIEQQFGSLTSASSSTIGGVKKAADIMGKAKLDLETSVMNQIEEENGDLAMNIRDNMFLFENMGDLDNRSIQALMREVENEQLMIALKSTSDEVTEKFMGNMSQRAGAMFLDEMEQLPPQRLTDVEDAQRDILRTARKMQDKGELILASSDGGDFV
jgi:flagellar motor switch protein FliG